MTRGPGDFAAAADGFARDWRAVRADPDIQFATVDLPEPEGLPEWLVQLGEFLAAVLRPIGRVLGQAGPAVPWIAGGIAAILVLALLWRLRDPMRRRFGRKAAEARANEWQPEPADALALLEEADRLAADGHYDEATHLLLRRSVGHIAAARPGLLEPSSTAREIAALPALSEAARSAFATIAERVERSLFALRRLSANDWRAARAAYAEFALAAPRPVDT